MKSVNSVKHRFTDPAITLIFGVEFYISSSPQNFRKSLGVRLSEKNCVPLFSPELRLFGVQTSVSRKRRFITTEQICQKNVTNYQVILHW